MGSAPVGPARAQAHVQAWPALDPAHGLLDHTNWAGHVPIVT